METKIGTTGYKREEGGTTLKVSKLRLDDPLNLDLCKKAEAAGVPPVISCKQVGDEYHRIAGWVFGKELKSYELEWTDEMFSAFGEHMALLHNAGVSVWDLFPKNIIWTGTRCVFIDRSKFYESDFPEFDSLKEVVLNYGFAEHLKEAFIDGYQKHRPFDYKDILTKLIEVSYDGYQDITLNGELLRKNARSNTKIKLVRTEDIEGQRVYDLGCSIGELTRSLAKMKPLSVEGFDKQARGRYTITTLSRLLARLERIEDRCLFHSMNVEEQMFETLYGKRGSDTTFCCALIGHIRGDRDQFLRDLDTMTRKVLYVETNLGGNPVQLMDYLKQFTTFKKVEYLGDTSDHDRGHNGYHLIRCSR